MDATIWHNPNCSTSRKVLEHLRGAGANVTVVQYLKQPPSRAELARLFDRAGMSAQGGLRLKEPGAKALVARGADEDEILDAMARDPILIERPLVETGKGVRLARPLEKVDEIL